MDLKTLQLALGFGKKGIHAALLSKISEENKACIRWKKVMDLMFPVIKPRRFTVQKQGTTDF